jgi:hypothetical protein
MAEVSLCSLGEHMKGVKMSGANPEPLPARRADVHVRAAAAVLLCFMMGGLVGELVSPAPDRDGIRFDWLATWGNTLEGSSVSAIFSYLATTLVLFGISVGGQSQFASQRHQLSVRRSVGVVGILVAMAALSLVVFDVAAAFTSPDAIPLLVVIIPMATVAWYFGIEVGRYLVPSYETQLSGAEKSESDTVERLMRVPPATGSTALAYATVLVFAALMGILTASPTGQQGPHLWELAALAAAFFGVTFILIIQTCAETLVSDNPWSTFGLRLMAYAIYTAMTMTIDLSTYIRYPIEDSNLIGLFIIQMLAPVLFFIPLPTRAPQWMIDVSLSGALARVCERDLERRLKDARSRVDRLQVRAQDADAQ